jgi:putative membrane protein
MILVHSFRLGLLLFGGLLTLAFWVGLIALIVLAVRTCARHESGRPDGSASDDALDILKERYARGEITKEQYDRMRRDLVSR